MKSIRLYCALLLMLTTVGPAYSQHAAYLGHDVSDALLSLNYEYRFKALSLRSGVGYSVIPAPESFVPYLSIPFGASWLIGESNHKLNIGLGCSPWIPMERSEYKLLIVKWLLAYRYQRSQGLFLQAGVSQMIAFPMIWPNLSIGYSFGSGSRTGKPSVKLPRVGD